MERLWHFVTMKAKKKRDKFIRNFVMFNIIFKKKKKLYKEFLSYKLKSVGRSTSQNFNTVASESSV